MLPQSDCYHSGASVGRQTEQEGGKEGGGGGDLGSESNGNN